MMQPAQGQLLVNLGTMISVLEIPKVLNTLTISTPQHKKVINGLVQTTVRSLTDTIGSVTQTQQHHRQSRYLSALIFAGISGLTT